MPCMGTLVNSYEKKFISETLNIMYMVGYCYWLSSEQQAAMIL
jgi:hypothetical protein